MADTGTDGENIGGINVSIGADYSPLEAAFSTAQDKAQAAGANIADALVSGAAGAGNIGDEIAGQLDQIGQRQTVQATRWRDSRETLATRATQRRPAHRNSRRWQRNWPPSVRLS